jgi:hypothetical protein
VIVSLGLNNDAANAIKEELCTNERLSDFPPLAP